MAREERRRVELLVATRPSAVARRAVALERVRLANDVEDSIRDCVSAIADELDRIDEARPVDGLRRVHALTRRTTSDLRRQLGLLREVPGEQDAPVRATVAEPVVTRGALVCGATMAALGALEASVFLVIGDSAGWSVGSVFVTALAAATIGGRRRPAAALLVFAGLTVGGSLIGLPVVSGFWIAITPPVLVWCVAARPLAGPVDLSARAAAVGAVVGAVTWALGRDDPENLGILLVVLAVALVGGALVGRQRWVETRSRRRAEARARELSVVAEHAVRAERATAARELHDVVSHAVGVIALQAGAAELSWPNDPAAVRRAIAVVRRTTADTLAELDRLPLSAASSGHSHEDLLSLVERSRQAGTPVDLTVVGDVTQHAHVVHRVVQESLTNAMRHAPGAPVAVRVLADDGGTRVSVSDTGPGPRSEARPGYGLVGLAERVDFAHGSFEAGPGPQGRGFRVAVSLPHVDTLSTR
jgi:signal transduction histidine kinase